MDIDAPNASDDVARSETLPVSPYLEHLRTLAICHYVLGGVLAVFSLMPILHVAVGAAIVSGAFDGLGGRPPAPFPFPDPFGWFFIIAGSTCIVTGLSFAVSIALAGKYLATRRRWLYCLIVAGLACLFTPLGTILGVFTILTLTRPEVKAAFKGSAS